MNLLARHVGWNVPSLAVPRRSRVDGVFKFFSRLFDSSESTEAEIGSLGYDNKKRTRLIVPQGNEPSYEVQIEAIEAVPCFFVPSHRSVYRYHAVSEIPTARISRSEAFQRVWNTSRERFFGGHNSQPPSFHMKGILIAWSIFGRGNQDMAPDPELTAFYEGFQSTLRRVLPPSLGFKRLSIRNRELVVECSAGDFMIDAASGGLSTIIDLAWQVFMFSSPQDAGFTVLIDEVENHLHPIMQKRVLSDFLEAFPEVRFVVSTHSPLVVNSVRDSFVYALRYDNDRRVTSTRLDMVRQARTATQILDEVLGVSSTLPTWAEQELRQITDRFSAGTMDETRFKELRQNLEEIGLADYFPQALGYLLDAKQK